MTQWNASLASREAREARTKFSPFLLVVKKPFLLIENQVNPKVLLVFQGKMQPFLEITVIFTKGSLGFKETTAVVSLKPSQALFDKIRLTWLARFARRLLT